MIKTLYQDNGGLPEANQVYVFHYDQSGRLIQNSNYRPDTQRHMRDRHFIWMDDMPVGYLETVYRANGNVLSQELHYLTADHLNTPRFTTNENGIKSWEWTADAFGIGELDLDPDGDGVNVNMRLRFPGQYDDEASITFYNYFRDYDPTIGRYMQSDPIGFEGGINTYSYALNNSLFLIDPYGLDITVSFNPNAAAGFGHVGLGVNTPSTVGQRPQSGANFIQIGLGLNVPGEISVDPVAPSSITIPTTPQQDQAAQQCIDARTQQEQDYNLYSNNCAQFVQQCLGTAGINMPNTPFPGVLFDNLQQSFVGSQQ